MSRDNMWNTALDIAHIESKFDAIDEEMPVYIHKRLDTLYAALYTLSKQERIDRAFITLEKLLFDELIGNGKSNNATIYANALTLINSARDYRADIGEILDAAREEVQRRFRHRQKNNA